MQLQNKKTALQAIQDLHDLVSESLVFDVYTIADIMISIHKARTLCTEQEFSTLEYDLACQLVDVLISINNL